MKIEVGPLNVVCGQFYWYLTHKNGLDNVNVMKDKSSYQIIKPSLLYFLMGYVTYYSLHLSLSLHKDLAKREGKNLDKKEKKQLIYGIK